MEEELVALETLKPGQKFMCPWNGKTFELMGITPSAAWVEVIEEQEVERKSRKTGETKIIIQKKKKNEPWSRGTRVKVL